MKQGIHPNYHEVTIVCSSCGTSWQTRSTARGQTLKTDLCSNCHPFYTGEQRIVDTAGQVDRFMKRMQLRQEAKPKKADNRAGAKDSNDDEE